MKKVDVQYCDQFGYWRHYQTKHNLPEAHRLMHRRVNQTGLKHRLVEKTGYGERLIDLANP